jgi:hypothetical protein
MPTVTETPDQMLERLERMGLERVRALIARGHFEPKTMGLVNGWIARKEREQRGPDPAPAEPENDLRVAVERGSRQSQRAATGAKAAHEAAAKAQRTAWIAIIVSGSAALVSILSLFALAIR